jgi:hypothetical protein
MILLQQNKKRRGIREGFLGMGVGFLSVVSKFIMNR